jgi:hypothetical protein
MSDAFRTELRKFDAERVLPAWDGLVRSQQARLEALKIPTMFVTNEAGDVEVRIETSLKHSHGSFRPHTKRPFLSEAG